ncbi:MAG: hypothetical protein ACOC6F_04255 [bacterium]
MAVDLDDEKFNLATYDGRCAARQDLFRRALSDDDLKTANAVIVDAGKDSMRQKRYNQGSQVKRIAVHMTAGIRERADECRAQIAEAQTRPLAPGLSPPNIESEASGTGSDKEANHEQRQE